LAGLARGAKVKKALKKVVYDNASDVKLNEEIETFLRNYRNMPHSEEQIIPAHVVFRFKPRTALSIFDKNIRKKEKEKKNLGRKVKSLN
jgi:hypothetical protein